MVALLQAVRQQGGGQVASARSSNGTGASLTRWQMPSDARLCTSSPGRVKLGKHRLLAPSRLGSLHRTGRVRHSHQGLWPPTSISTARQQRLSSCLEQGGVPRRRTISASRSISPEQLYNVDSSNEFERMHTAAHRTVHSSLPVKSPSTWCYSSSRTCVCIRTCT